MLEKRIIPTLQLHGNKAVKTLRFKGPEIYLGDPVNIAKIWSDYEAHEIIVTDITNTLNTGMLKKLARNVFVPIAYGGGIQSLEDAREALQWGAEKVILGRNATRGLIDELRDEVGSQSIVVSIDHDDNGKTYTDGGELELVEEIVNRAKDAAHYGAGEILLHSITRDGTYEGYDLENMVEVVQAVNVPVVVCGGASSIEDMKRATDLGASGAAAGSLFSLHGLDRNVLVSYKK
jgi:cyclase